jgi:hypothetical protein
MESMRDIDVVTTLNSIWLGEQGQDLVEYSLLIAFIVFAAAALFLFGAGGSLQGIWGNGSTQLTAANSSAS